MKPHGIITSDIVSNGVASSRVATKNENNGIMEEGTWTRNRQANIARYVCGETRTMKVTEMRLKIRMIIRALE